MPDDSSIPSAVPDVLAPGLEVVFCAINPGRVSAAAGAHFANPRNDFWRLLHRAGFTPHQLAPDEQGILPQLGIGLTNAAYRTTPGSGDLRAPDFIGSAERLERIAQELRPAVIAFVGKEAYRGIYRERPDHGLDHRQLGETRLFVLPSTSPANAAVSWDERLAWFCALRDLVAPIERRAARAVVLDADGAILLVRFDFPWADHSVWALPGGGLERGETSEDGVRRELAEETGLNDPLVGPLVWRRTPRWRTESGGWAGQHEEVFLVRCRRFSPSPRLSSRELQQEHVTDVRWWSPAELESSAAVFAPQGLPELVQALVWSGPPTEPLELTS